MNLPIIWSASVAAAALLCLGLPRHFRQCSPALLPASGYRLLRQLGWLSLAIAVYAGYQELGWSRGPLLALGALMVSALGVALLLPLRPRLVAIAGTTATIATLLLWIRPN